MAMSGEKIKCANTAELANEGATGGLSTLSYIENRDLYLTLLIFKDLEIFVCRIPAVIEQKTGNILARSLSGFVRLL
jgi:hypothetical protein